MRLKGATVSNLFVVGASYIRSEVDQESLVFDCTVLEGAACYFAKEGDNNNVVSRCIDSDLEKTVVGELGWKYIEHSKSRTGAINSVTVRCTRSLNADRQFACKVYRGRQWEELTVE